MQFEVKSSALRNTNEFVDSDGVEDYKENKEAP